MECRLRIKVEGPEVKAVGPSLESLPHSLYCRNSRILSSRNSWQLELELESVHPWFGRFFPIIVVLCEKDICCYSKLRTKLMPQAGTNHFPGPVSWQQMLSIIIFLQLELESLARAAELRAWVVYCHLDSCFTAFSSSWLYSPLIFFLWLPILLVSSPFMRFFFTHDLLDYCGIHAVIVKIHYFRDILTYHILPFGMSTEQSKILVILLGGGSKLH